MKQYGLVLGGGGAKGGYEIGVWRALRELNIPISTVCGASVGALNGAIIVQEDYEIAYKLWTSLSIQSVIKVEKEIVAASEHIKKTSTIINTIKNAFKSGGLDVTPLKELLNGVIDEEKIRKSPIDFGMVTFSLSNFKPITLFKNDIPEGKLVDYLLASSCFPAFKPQEIDNKKFIDGGVYDNIPVSMLLQKNIKDAIVVDISGPGRIKKIFYDDMNIVYIKNSDDLGKVLDFDGEKSKDNIELGYYDTMRKYGKYIGEKYFILPQNNNESSYYREQSKSKIEDTDNMYNFLNIDIFERNTPANKLIVFKLLRTIKKYSKNSKDANAIYEAMLEITAEELRIKKLNNGSPYTVDELTEEVLKQYNKIKEDNLFKAYNEKLKSYLSLKNQIEFDMEIKKLIIEGKFLMLFNTQNEAISKENIIRFRRFLALAFPKICIANMFITMLIKNMSKAN